MKTVKSLIVLLLAVLAIGCKTVKTTTQKVETKAVSAVVTDVETVTDTKVEVTAVDSFLDTSIVEDSVSETIHIVKWSKPDSAGVQHKVEEATKQIVRTKKKATNVQVVKETKIDSAAVVETTDNSVANIQEQTVAETKTKTKRKPPWNLLVGGLVAIAILVYKNRVVLRRFFGL